MSVLNKQAPLKSGAFLFEEAARFLRYFETVKKRIDAGSNQVYKDLILN